MGKQTTPKKPRATKPKKEDPIKPSEDQQPDPSILNRTEFDGKSVRSNICMDCEKACGGRSVDRGCEWSRSFKPVPGWEAEMVYLKQSPGNFVLTYHITQCPKFVKSPDRPGSKSGVMSEYESEEFLKDPLAYLKKHDHGVNLEKLAKKNASKKTDKEAPTKARAKKKGARRYVY